ncbi:MAG: hypothetical protein EZS28_034137, partial [Streblomastix strix]
MLDEYYYRVDDEEDVYLGGYGIEDDQCYYYDDYDQLSGYYYDYCYQSGICGIGARGIQFILSSSFGGILQIEANSTEGLLFTPEFKNEAVGAHEWLTRDALGFTENPNSGL